jgi:hypothetical protein
VLVRNEARTKSDSIYKPTPFTVIDRKGTMISVKNDAGHCMTRNSSVIKSVDLGIVGKKPDIRWGLRLQPFKMQIKYRSGKDNASDFMSRHPLKHKED